MRAVVLHVKFREMHILLVFAWLLYLRGYRHFIRSFSNEKRSGGTALRD